jgi:PhzF family phenazine biosynthesis protein
MYDLINSRRDLLQEKIIKIKVKDVYLDVFNRINESDSIFITAPVPQFNQLTLGKTEIADALNIGANSIAGKYKLALINAGLNTLIVPLNNLETCLAAKPGEPALKNFCLINGIDIILIFTDEVAGSANRYRTRVFAPKFGYLEDPATGSGNSAFGNYLLHNNLWDGKTLSIEQNNNYDFPNIVKLDTVKNNDRINIVFGGAAVVKIEGQYKLSLP